MRTNRCDLVPRSTWCSKRPTCVASAITACGTVCTFGLASQHGMLWNGRLGCGPRPMCVCGRAREARRGPGLLDSRPSSVSAARMIFLDAVVQIFQFNWFGEYTDPLLQQPSLFLLELSRVVGTHNHWYLPRRLVLPQCLHHAPAAGREWKVRVDKDRTRTLVCHLLAHRGQLEAGAYLPPDLVQRSGDQRDDSGVIPDEQQPGLILSRFHTLISDLITSSEVRPSGCRPTTHWHSACPCGLSTL